MRSEPYADYLQFVVQDAHAEVGVIDGDSWDKAVKGWRIAVERHAVSVGTARIDVVPVVLELRGQPPDCGSFEGFDHVVEADIDVPSGELAVTGATQLPSQVEPIRLTPGRHRIRIGYAPTDYRPAGSDDDEPGDYLTYEIALWPVAVESAVVVLKQGPEPWAY
jgi:hypothetical protein